MSSPRPDPRDVGFYYSLAQVGLEMVAPIGVGVVIDYYCGTLPWITVVMAVLGPVAGFVHLVHMLNQRNKANSQKKDRDAR